MSNLRDTSISICGGEVQFMVGVNGLETAKQTAMWGSFGKGGVEHCSGTCPEHPLRWKRLMDCETEHLKAILRTQRPQASYFVIITSILEDRKQNEHG